jgi:BirA family biotin operon repressor/biotin-[acetyl-CoA-carboxylase] ligase
MPGTVVIRTDEELASALATSTRFGRLVHLSECASTQDLAAADPGADDAVFWADHQTRGRGRQGRSWDDEPGADLTATFRTVVALPDPVALPAVVPVAVLQALEPAAGRELRIKWPNDVLLDGRKLAGVLIDAGGGGPGRFLIGIGVNVSRTRFPRELEPVATSLALTTGREHDRAALLLDLARRLDAALTALQRGAMRELEALFLARLGLAGRRVVVDAGGPQTGVLTGLDTKALVLDATRRFALGLVRGIRAAEA